MIGFFSESGFNARGSLRQPDCLASTGARARAKFWQQRVLRRLLFAVSGSVGLPARDWTMPRAKAEHLVEGASALGKILGVRIPLVDEDDETWLAPPSRRQPPPAIREPLPGAITVVQA